MNILDNIYKNSLLQNENYIKFWEEYLQNLNALDLNMYSEKLTVPVLVPIGNRILFRGAIKHTNEVMVSLGADYFTKCSVKQAEVLRQHRIKDAKMKLESYVKEKEYLESQISFNKENVHGTSGQDIIEMVSEEEDKAWREQHRERVRQYHLSKNKETDSSKEDMTDEDLWIRLEELELQEELENEMDGIEDKVNIDESDSSSYDSFIITEDDVSNISKEEIKQNNIQNEAQITHNVHKQTSKLDLLQQVIDRQKMLAAKLTQLKNIERVQSKTEKDLMSKLDKMDQLEELEDEMDRLDDILEEEDDDDSAPTISEDNSVKIKRNVSFADNSDTETLEINFKHSSIEPCNESYNSEKGIVKPSDIYEAYSNFFTNETTSILKKSKYGHTNLTNEINSDNLKTSFKNHPDDTKVPLENDNMNVSRSIVINDVVEKNDENDTKVANDRRPIEEAFLKSIMIYRNLRYLSRRYSQAVTFRTTESSPTQHNENQVGLFYTINNDICKQLFGHGGLPKSYLKQTKTFTETTLMVRSPALDIMNCIKLTDLNKPVNRYVLYGELGAGKSLTIAHLLHYAHENNFLIVHVPWVSEWLRRVPRHKEMSNSPTKEGFVDLPLDAAAWLLHFKTQNQSILKTPDLRITKEYVWSKREKTEMGAPLAELVELGIARVKYACDVIEALVNEIKILSNNKQCKTFVAIDGFNTFLYPLTRLKTPTKKTVTPEEVTLTAPFMEITKNDWTNGVIVISADQMAVPQDHQESHLPKYLLYKKGFEHIDPFIPVEVARYSEKEFLSCASYYRDRLWLRGPPETEEELKLASACNPYKFMELCAPL
ncbi:unnamed protein product, partial [Brenthis ino]